jgi:hypothetical protein
VVSPNPGKEIRGTVKQYISFFAEANWNAPACVSGIAAGLAEEAQAW